MPNCTKCNGTGKVPHPTDKRRKLVECSCQSEDVVVHNIMTNKPVTLQRRDLGGCCDPSTERYHCM